MTTLAVVAIVAIVALVVVVAVLIAAHGRERRAWAVERRSLIDRAIARHSGEVIAFDRAQRPKADREPAPVIEGLN